MQVSLSTTETLQISGNKMIKRIWLIAMSATVLTLMVAPVAVAQQAANDMAAKGTPKTELVSRENAITAYNSFNADPINNLNVAPTFLKFIETDGEAHVVLHPILTAWMYEDHEAEARAILYAAYMGGNMNAQLLDESAGDDPVEAMRSVLIAYEKLKVKHERLSIPLLDSLQSHAANDTLADAIEKILN